jgi:hypothetical protein
MVGSRGPAAKAAASTPCRIPGPSLEGTGRRVVLRLGTYSFLNRMTNRSSLGLGPATGLAGRAGGVVGLGINGMSSWRAGQSLRLSIPRFMRTPS